VNRMVRNVARSASRGEKPVQEQPNARKPVQHALIAYIHANISICACALHHNVCSTCHAHPAGYRCGQCAAVHAPDAWKSEYATPAGMCADGRC
jgi:hypothetical protein